MSTKFRTWSETTAYSPLDKSLPTRDPGLPGIRGADISSPRFWLRDPVLDTRSPNGTAASSGWMTQLLEVVFGELGISQYLGSFLEQGFDTWETILDITESDLYVRRRLGERERERQRGVLTRRLWTAMRWE